MGKKKKWTGERLETFVFNETTIEHLHRYAIAYDLVFDKKVLDIACGEGYGANLLAAGAEHVTGVDIDEMTIAHADGKYELPNLNFLTGRAEQIPCDDKSFDAVVSFETLEHLSDHEQMMREIKRVLVPDGLLIISTPDKRKYSDIPGTKNHFHQKELYRNEFDQLLRDHFTNVRIVNQRMLAASLVTTGEPDGFETFSGNYDTVGREADPTDALYLIALASDGPLPRINNSVFNGQSILEDALLAREEMVTKTITYRLGHVLLFPFKWVRGLFKK